MDLLAVLLTLQIYICRAQPPPQDDMFEGLEGVTPPAMTRDGSATPSSPMAELLSAPSPAGSAGQRCLFWEAPHSATSSSIWETQQKQSPNH